MKIEKTNKTGVFNLKSKTGLNLDKVMINQDGLYIYKGITYKTEKDIFESINVKDLFTLIVKAISHKFRIRKSGISIYSPEERREEYCTKSLVLACYEEDWYRVFNPYYTSDPSKFIKVRECFDISLKSEGYFFEEGTSWYGGLYKID